MNLLGDWHSMRLNVKLGFVLVTAASMFSFESAGAAEVTVLAVAATKEVIVELIPQFEKSSGHKVAITWTGSCKYQEANSGRRGLRPRDRRRPCD